MVPGHSPRLHPGVTVTSIDVTNNGAGYTAPRVQISGGGTTRSATATAYGSVDAIPLISGGSGYSFPTVSIDLPNSPDGVVAQARAVCDNAPTAVAARTGPGTIASLVVTNPGSGYSVAPGITIRDGTIEDPIRNNPGTGAAARATLTINQVAINTFGSGYTLPPRSPLPTTPPPTSMPVPALPPRPTSIRAV